MSIKQKIWNKLDQDGYVTDSELAKIYGKEPNFYIAEVYKREWLNLQKDKEWFADKKIIDKHNHRGRYFVRIEGQEENAGYKVSKAFYLTIKI